jgi:hypothetical protein
LFPGVARDMSDFFQSEFNLAALIGAACARRQKLAEAAVRDRFGIRVVVAGSALPAGCVTMRRIGIFKEAGNAGGRWPCCGHRARATVDTRSGVAVANASDGGGLIVEIRSPAAPR